MPAFLFRIWSFVRCTIIFASDKRNDLRKRKMFKPLRKIANALRVPTSTEREMAYLNGARDMVDLEFRQREIERGMFRSRF